VAIAVLPALNQAAEDGDTKKYDLLRGGLPDDLYGIEKRTAAAKYRTARTKIDGEKKEAQTNSYLRYLTTPGAPVTEGRALVQDSKLPENEKLELLKKFDARLEKDLKEAEEAEKQGLVIHDTNIATSYAIGLFANGQAQHARPQKSDNVNFTEEQVIELGAQKYREIAQQLHANDPVAAQQWLTTQFVNNNYRDPDLHQFLKSGPELLSPVLMNQPGNQGQQSRNDFMARFQEYEKLRFISPEYAKNMAGEQGFNDYETIRSLLKTEVGGLERAVKILAEMKGKDITVNLTDADKKKIKTAASWVGRPFFSFNAVNTGPIEQEGLQTVINLMRGGASLENATASMGKIIASNYTQINHWLVRTGDARIDEELKGGITEIFEDMFDKYLKDHPEDAKYVGKKSEWTLDFNPDTGHFQLVAKDEMTYLPNPGSAGVISIEEAYKRLPDIRKRAIYKKKSEANSLDVFEQTVPISTPEERKKRRESQAKQAKADQAKADQAKQDQAKADQDKAEDPLGLLPKNRNRK